MKKTQDSFHTILKIVIGVVFAISVLSIVLKAALTSSEDRSHAAEAQITYKSWEFSGANSEGWVLTNVSGCNVDKGYFNGSATSNIVFLSSKQVGTVLPVGNKFITLRISVGPPHILQTPTSIPSRYYTPTPQIIVKQTSQTTQTTNETQTFTRQTINSPPPFSIDISYNTPNGSKTLSSISGGRPDGSFYVYTVKLPEIDSVSLNSLSFKFSPLASQATVSIDWVRLVGSSQPTRPTGWPTTSVGCTSNGSTCTVTVCPTMSPCPVGAECEQAKLPCVAQKGICQTNRCVVSVTPTPVNCSPNGSKCNMNICPTTTPCPVGKMCPAIMQACPIQEGVCQNNRCVSKTIPPPPMSPSCGPVACKVPPSGCKYINSTSCSCGDLLCSVATVTPTPTQSGCMTVCESTGNNCQTVCKTVINGPPVKP